MPSSPRLIAATLLALFPLNAFPADGNAAKGRRSFLAQCSACHTTTADNRITGPALLGVIGRKAGTLDGFAFSDAMKKSGLTWNTATLDQYLAAPAKVVPGTTMALAVPNAATRADLIAFLNTLTPAPSAPATPPPAK
jgi:cytochrome c